MAYWGLLKRKESLVLTWRGWSLLLLCLGVALVILADSIHPFLAVTRPVHGDILVVEGWMPDNRLEAALALFNERRYRLLVTTGGPLGKGHYLSAYGTDAELAAATLHKLGLARDRIVAVAAPPASRDRTFESALALREWLSQSGLVVRSLDVYSKGAHARRTWLLFRKALGSDIAVGIIAADPDYDAERWWTSSSGVRAVVGESVAYLYARFLFSPRAEETAPHEQTSRFCIPWMPATTREPVTMTGKRPASVGVRPDTRGCPYEWLYT
jgi:hypothetical protein